MNSRRIIKAMSIFSGVQMIQIVCAVVRNKFIALWIGPVGVGLISLFNSVIDIFNKVSNLELRQSSVRDISAASDDEFSSIAKTVTIIASRLSVAGAALMCAASPLISNLTFGTVANWWMFCLLSLCVMFSTLTGARLAVMQGRGLLRPLAQASMWGAVGGTVVSIVMYYFFGLKGILPSLLAFSLSTYVAASWLSRKELAQARGLRISWRKAFADGKDMIVLGLMMTVSGVITLVMNYIFLLWLNRSYGTDTVGLYQAGYTLINSYVGVIFSALALEFYPRIVKTIDSARATSLAVSHEITVILWVFMPLIICFVTLDEWIVSLLYSSKFGQVTPYITIAVTGMIFRGISYCMAYVILARGEGRTYIVTEVTSVVIGLALNIAAFSLWGFRGLGCAFVAWYAIYTVIVGVVYRYRYRMTIHRKVLWLIILSVGVAILAPALKQYVAWWAPLCILPFVVPSAIRYTLRK